MSSRNKKIRHSTKSDDIFIYIFDHGRRVTRKNTIQCGRRGKYVWRLDVLLLHEDRRGDDDEGHGATMLSLRSHMNPMPEVLSNIASEGRLGNRQPDSR